MTGASAGAPRGALLLGHLPAFARDPLDFLSGAAAYGPVVPLRFGRTRAFLLTDPALLEQVLVARRDDFVKARALRAQRPLLGQGLLTSEGDSWLGRRRLAQPAFHRDRVAGYGRVMVAEARRAVDRWRDGESRELHADMKRLTIAIVTRTLFGASVGDDTERLGAALDDAMQQSVNRRGLARLVPDWMPLPPHRRYRRAVHDLDAAVAGIIRARRACGSAGDDLLSMLMHARDDHGAGLDDRQLRDEAMTLFVAGVDTPALSLAWSWALLAQDVAAAESLAAEVDGVLGGRAPDAQDLPRLRFTEAVVKEALRLYPPAWIMAREAVRDTAVGGHRVPRGALVLMSQWAMHRDARFFAQPERFHPGRWLDGSLERLPKLAYFPFGAGPRMCIGASFAMMEAVLVLALLAQQFHFAVSTGTPVNAAASMTLRPAGGVRIVIRRRQGTPMHESGDCAVPATSAER